MESVKFPAESEGKAHFLDYWRVVRIRMPLIFLVFLLVVGTASVVTYLMPRQYMSSVSMQIKESDTSLRLFGQEAGERFDPRFMTTQFEIIQKKEILYPVIALLQLDRKWKASSKDLAYSMLRKRLDIREVRNTELVQISIFDQDRTQAADIANAIAEEYQRRRIAEAQQWVSRSLVQLRDEVGKQREKVEELREVATQTRVQFGINDLNPESVEDPLQARERVLLSEEEQVNNEKLKVTALRAKHDQVSRMTDDQIMRSIRALEVEDPTILHVLPSYQEAASEEQKLLSSGLGVNHPTVRALRAKKDAMNKQLQEQIQMLRKTLADNLKIAEDQLRELESGLRKSRDLQQESKTRSSAYFAAKNNYLQAKKVLEAAEMRLSTEAMQRMMPQSPVTIWERAEPAQFPARPRVVLNIVLAIVVGLALGVGLAFFVEYLDTSVKTIEDIETHLSAPVLGVIPKKIGLLTGVAPNHPDAEAYRIIQTNIGFARESQQTETIAITSGGAGEGKSTTAANLASIFAREGYRTLLVDADLHRPGLHKIFGTPNERGFADCLLLEQGLDEAPQQTAVENLYLLPSGKPSSQAIGLLNARRIRKFIEEIKGRFDIALFDSPPILGMSDAAVLASALGSVIIVVQHRRFPRAMLQRIKQILTNVGGTILGVVLNNVDSRDDQYYEYAANYRNYYPKPRAAGGKPVAERAVAVHQDSDSY